MQLASSEADTWKLAQLSHLSQDERTGAQAQPGANEHT